ncbi:MAG: hypothetical protein RSC00_01790, partial [Ruthenibacterium sp.]
SSARLHPWQTLKIPANETSRSAVFQSFDRKQDDNKEENPACKRALGAPASRIFINDSGFIQDENGNIVYDRHIESPREGSYRSFTDCKKHQCIGELLSSLHETVCSKKSRHRVSSYFVPFGTVSGRKILWRCRYGKGGDSGAKGK